MYDKDAFRYRLFLLLAFLFFARTFLRSVLKYRNFSNKNHLQTEAAA